MPPDNQAYCKPFRRQEDAQRSCGWSGWGGEGSAHHSERADPARKPHRRAEPAAAFRAAQAGVRGLQVPCWGAGRPEALSGPQGGFGRDTLPFGRITADTRAGTAQPCHYRKAGSDRASGSRRRPVMGRPDTAKTKEKGAAPGAGVRRALPSAHKCSASATRALAGFSKRHQGHGPTL